MCIPPLLAAVTIPFSYHLQQSSHKPTNNHRYSLSDKIIMDRRHDSLFKNSELFIGLIAPTGSDRDLVIEQLELAAKDYNYTVKKIKISKQIPKIIAHFKDNNDLKDDLENMKNEFKDDCESCFDNVVSDNVVTANNFCRTKILMKLGTLLRNKIEEEVLFNFAIKELHDERDITNTKFIYVFDSIKTPKEASLLKAVYGESVSLISIYTKKKNREKNIENKQLKTEKDKNKKSKELIKIDENENDTKGQQVRDTFPLADYFIETSSIRILKQEITRYLSILFDYRFETPRRDEYCMFLAYAASLRSASLSRQVGVAICSTDGAVISLGCNEVPKYGGGLYWPGNYDYRDHKIGEDTNDKIKEDIINEVLKKLKPIFSDTFSDEDFETKYNNIIIDKLKIAKHLKGSDIRNLLEFGRAVHAEMAAITDAAMRGIEVKNSILYSTTFPCHLCARHIVSSGIKKVLYIEPYPKSKTESFYSDSVAVNPHDDLTDRVVFEPYIGMSPTSYIKSFTSPKNTRKNESGIVTWEKSNAKLRFKEKDLIYLCREFMIVDITIKNLKYNGNTTGNASTDIRDSVKRYSKYLDDLGNLE